MTTRARRQPGRLLLGAVLVIVGAVLLAAQLLDVPVGLLWPGFVLIPGVVLLGGGLAGATRGSEGLTIAGTIVVVVGALLTYQNTTNHWESWAYAWALTGPGAIGLGMLGAAVANGRSELAAPGRVLVMMGLALFAVGAVVFEGILEISGRQLGIVGDVALPLVVIVLGLLLVFRRPSSRTAAPPSAPPATPPAPPAPPPTPPREAPADPAAQPAGPSSTSGPLITPVDVGWDDAEDLHLHIATGACKMIVRQGDADRWVSGTYRDPSRRRPLTVTREGPGRARISQDHSPASLSGLVEGTPTIELALGTARPFRLAVDTGASDSQIELGGIPLAGLRVRHGAGRVALAFSAPNPVELDDLMLSFGAASTTVDQLGNANAASVYIDGGAASCRLDLGQSVMREGEVRISMAMASVELVVPADAAVAVQPESTLGGISADSGFVQRDGGYWTQAAVEAGRPVVTVRPNLALGQLKLRVRRQRAE